MQCFIGMLDIDYAAGFQCPICSSLSPKDQVVVFDGKTMGIMRKRMVPEEQDNHKGEEGTTSSVIVFLRGPSSHSLTLTC